jgi:hypothetical protein
MLGTQFRQWATAHLSKYMVKGLVMDDERLKTPAAGTLSMNCWRASARSAYPKSALNQKFCHQHLCPLDRLADRPGGGLLIGVVYERRHEPAITHTGQ